MHKQRGMSFIGLVFVLSVIIISAITAMKIVPAYIEFNSVNKVIAHIAAQPDFQSMTREDARIAFAKSANIENITVVKPDEIILIRGENEIPVVGVDYQVLIPLFGNLSVQINFSASTNPSAWKAKSKELSEEATSVE